MEMAKRGQAREIIKSKNLKDRKNNEMSSMWII